MESFAAHHTLARCTDDTQHEQEAIQTSLLTSPPPSSSKPHLPAEGESHGSVPHDTCSHPLRPDPLLQPHKDMQIHTYAAEVASEAAWARRSIAFCSARERVRTDAVKSSATRSLFTSAQSSCRSAAARGSSPSWTASSISASCESTVRIRPFRTVPERSLTCDSPAQV
jgi:hypothetical protein